VVSFVVSKMTRLEMNELSVPPTTTLAVVSISLKQDSRFSSALFFECLQYRYKYK
jgi:hypothetical protein